jgi:tol-pal system protein YbgF
MVSWIASATKKTMPRAALLGIALAIGAAASGPALAQDPRTEALVNRLERLELDLGVLSRQVYAAPKGAPSGATGGAGLPTGGDYVSRLEARIGDLEGQITQLTGNVETLTHSNSELTSRLERMSKDNELRFQEIEKGGSPASGASSAPRAAAPQPDASATGASREGVLGTLNPRDLAAGAPKGGSAPPPAGQQQQRVSLPQGSPQQQYDFAYGLIEKARSDADYASAAQAFGDFLEKNPKGPLASNARYWMGESHYVRKDYNNAARVFLEGYQADQKGPKSPDTLLKLGMSLTNLDKKKEACATFDKLAKDFPDASSNIKRVLPRERTRAGCA